MVFSTLDLRNFSQQVNFSSVSGKLLRYEKDHITWGLKLRNKLKNPKAKICKVRYRRYLPPWLILRYVNKASFKFPDIFSKKKYICNLGCYISYRQNYFLYRKDSGVCTTGVEHELHPHWTLLQVHRDQFILCTHHQTIKGLSNKKICLSSPLIAWQNIEKKTFPWKNWVRPLNNKPWYFT